MSVKIAIFCSGSGSNAQKIIEYFEAREDINVSLMIANKADAFALERAKNKNIPAVHVPKSEFNNPDTLLALLKSHQIDYIILAGFLLLIPPFLVKAYPDKILNIHPALLPKYGGKGMYGHFVHEAVVANKEKESGLTIHLVNENYDEGAILFQAKCDVSPSDDAGTVAKNVLSLEHLYFSKVIDQFITGNKIL